MLHASEEVVSVVGRAESTSEKGGEFVRRWFVIIVVAVFARGEALEEFRCESVRACCGVWVHAAYSFGDMLWA